MAWSIEAFKLEFPNKADCLECSSPGELMCGERFGLVCKSCRIKKQDQLLTERSQQLGELCYAILGSGADGAISFDAAVKRSLETIAIMKRETGIGLAGKLQGTSGPANREPEVVVDNGWVE